MLRPTERIEHRARLVRCVGQRNHFGRFFELFRRTAANLRHFLRRVTRVVGLHQLEDSAGVFQRGVDFGEAAFIQLILPGRLVVTLLGFVPTGKMAAFEIERGFDEKGSVGMLLDILGLVAAGS